MKEFKDLLSSIYVSPKINITLVKKKIDFITYANILCYVLQKEYFVPKFEVNGKI
jgi:hypothetical protein